MTTLCNRISEKVVCFSTDILLGVIVKDLLTFLLCFRAVYFWCLYPKYIWIWLEFDYKIIQLDDSTKEAVITHTFLAGANEMRWDEKGVVVLDHFRVYVYQPVGTLSFTYPEGYSGQNNSEVSKIREIYISNHVSDCT